MSDISRRAGDKIKRWGRKVDAITRPPSADEVQAANVPILLVRAQESITQGESGSVKRLVRRSLGDEKGTEIEVGDEFDVYARFSDVGAGDDFFTRWVDGGYEQFSRGGAVQVIGPCGLFTPDISDPDTNFDEPYPSSCEGPDVLGVHLVNPVDNTFQDIRAEKTGTGPLTFETDSFSLTCAGGNVSCYITLTFNSLDTDGVEGQILKVFDDSLVQEYTNSLYSWHPLAGGNLQMGPSGTTNCVCTTTPYNLCISIPSR